MPNLEWVFVVVYQVGGFAREDGPTAKVGGVFTDITKANKVKMMLSGTVVPIILNEVPPGLASWLKGLGLDAD